MSKKLAGWLCLQFLAVNLLGLVGALAENAKTDSASSPTVAQGESPTNINDGSQREGNSSQAGQQPSVNSSASPSPLQPGQGLQPKSQTNDSAANAQSNESGAQVTPVELDKVKQELQSAEEQAKAQRAQPVHPSDSATKASPVASSKKIVLYGRIEQIAAGKGAQFPIVLKSMQAKLDSRHPDLKASASDTALRGSVVSSFPTDFDGVWGGNLTVWTMQQSPLCWQIDPDEAKWTQAAVKSGLAGQTNFNFSRDRANRIELEPARILFAVPIKDTNQQEQLDQLLNSGSLDGQASNPGMADMMKQFVGSMANAMTVPMVLSLGNARTGGMERGLSGNEFEEQVVRNVIRELAPGVLEQQIVTSEAERNAKSGQLRYGYGESVIRLTKQSANQLYAQVATVTYTQDRQFRRKIILYGTLRRGQVMNTTPNPLAGLNDMLNSMPGGGGRGQMPRMPQLPPGQNPFENLFPH